MNGVRWFLALLVLVALGGAGCGGGGGGGGGGGNEERIIAVIPVTFDISFAPAVDPPLFCFADMDCISLSAQDQLGVAVTLLNQGTVQPPLEGPLRRVETNQNAAFIAGTLTDNQLGPLAAGFMVAPQTFPGCQDGDENDLTLLEPRPVAAVDLFGFEVTAFSLLVESWQRTSTTLMMTGQIRIYGKTASP